MAQNRAVYIREHLDVHKQKVDGVINRVRNALGDAVANIHTDLFPEPTDEHQSEMDAAVIERFIIEEL